MAMTILGNHTDFSGRASCWTLLMGQSIKLLYVSVLLLTIITLYGEICNAQRYMCDSFKYTEGSMFESNLNTVLNTLVRNTYQTGFSTCEYGESPDQIYGLLQCRGDTTVDECYDCSQQATNTIQQSCGNVIGGSIWFGLCFLRYESHSFFGQLDITGLYLYNVVNISSPNVFNAALQNLLYNMSAEAASGSKLYAFGTTTDFLFRKIYALVQCTRDLSNHSCTSCLSNAFDFLFNVYDGRQGAQGLTRSCIVRYEMYNFFYSIALPPPAESGVTRYPFNSTQNTASATCDPSSYIKGSVFESNLDSVLNDLVQQTSPTGLSKYLYTSERGESPDQIYGLLYCSIPNLCYNCSRNATTAIRQKCPYAKGGGVSSNICSLQYQNYNFLNVTLLPPATKEAPHNTVANISPKLNTRSKKIPTILGVVGGLLLVLIVCLFSTWRRLKSAIFQRGYEVHEQGEEDTPISDDRQIVFKMETLLAATENFHDDNKLGQGGFGPVYKGTTHDGKEIAVKRLSVNSIQGKKEFLNEVKLVAKIQHRNLVKLLGYCAGGSETLLVYEYLPNKSLDKILFDPNKRKHLDWQKRCNIILGVARGLLYLHQDSQPRIIHRDIKASNILLDEKLNPKIADFGLAKLFPEDESHVSTRVAGTYGYMAPEYAMQGQLSVKADVYSFGVLLLEIITGRKNTDYNLSQEMQILLGWAWRSYERGNIVQMIDPSIIETCHEEYALRCIHVGLLCTQADATLRPPMSTVTLMLCSDSVTLPDPTQPIVVSSITQITRPTSSASGLSHASATTTSASSLTSIVAPPSNADASITDLVPR